MGDGKKAAAAIHDFLSGGKPLTIEKRTPEEK
jgi:hypothetical protein